MQTYTLKAGDTIWSLARKFGVPAHLLLEVNEVSDPSKLKVGRTLTIPSVTTDTSEHAATGPALLRETPPVAPLAINRTRFKMPVSQFVAEETPKDLVMLHFTAGASADGAFNSWTATEARVATAYILDRDGTIYELFDPRFWAFHLGIPGAASANYKHDKRSVGIEIVNVGPLKENNGNLCWWPDNFSKKWCTPADTDKYVKASYRGFSHYAAFTEAQYASLGPLVRHLCERFSIPMTLPPAAQRTQADPAGFYKTFTGIASHQNFRADKFDVGPAFDWTRLRI